MNMLQKGMLLGLLVIAVLLQGCVSSGSVAEQSNVYNQGFNKMVDVVHRAARGSSLEIRYSEPSRNGTTHTVKFNKKEYANTQSLQGEQGTAFIEKLEDGKTRVTIENPEYSYSVPHSDRIDYKSILTKKINEILNG